MSYLASKGETNTEPARMNEMVSATGKRAVADLLDDDGDTHDSLLHSQGADGHRPPKKQRISTPSSEPSLSTLSYPSISTPILKQTPFQQPSQLISFSYTPEHVLEFTDSALRYFVDPPVGAKLDYGYERWVRKPDERGRLDGLLKAISQIRKDPMRAPNLPEIGLVSWRGVMTKYVFSLKLTRLMVAFD